VLEASTGLSDVQREHLRTIISSGEDLLGLINNILDHSRLESGSVTLESIPFSCRDVVEGALDSVAAVAQKKNLELCLLNPADADPPGLMGDPFRIKQILLNLLSNAVKFTHKGRVTVKWRWETLDEGKVRVEMDVEDTGIGIPAQSESRRCFLCNHHDG
jgi:signal transduction histidine kinase